MCVAQQTPACASTKINRRAPLRFTASLLWNRTHATAEKTQRTSETDSQHDGEHPHGLDEHHGLRCLSLTGHHLGSFRITVIDTNLENSPCENQADLMKTTREITAAEHPGANSRRRSLTRESFEDNQRGKHSTADNR